MNIQYLENILQAQELLPNGFSTSSMFINQPNPLDLVRKLQNNIQQQYLRTHILQLLSLKNRLIQQTLNKVSPVQAQMSPPAALPFQPLDLKIPALQNTQSLPPLDLSPAPPMIDLVHRNSSVFTFQSESDQPMKIEAPEGRNSRKSNIADMRTGGKIESSEEDCGGSDLRNQLRIMMSFLINNCAKASDEIIQLERVKYEKDPRLVQVFDILVKKYSVSSKSREEMIKYVLRKALKAVRNIMQKRLRIDYKDASSLLCKRYFKGQLGEENEGHAKMSKGKKKSSPSEDDDDDDDDLLKAMLPFRKNSKNKTMNSNFITEIFSSEEFCKDYEVYLTQIDDILEKDNGRKIEMFLKLVEERIKKNQIEALQSCKRMPWLKLWIDATKNVAFELATTRAWIETRKRVNGET